jgi:peptidoglycan/LPS O-acetylase OafA/YrhL
MSAPLYGVSLHSTWQLTASGVGALLLITSALRYRALGGLFAWRPVAWLGRISYGLYVYHFPILIALTVWQVPGWIAVVGLPAFAGWLLWMATWLGVTVATAAVSYYGYERWFLKLKGRFTVVPSRVP